MRFTLLLLFISTAAHARPSAPLLVCQSYPTAPACAGQTPPCLTCHSVPPALNPFGAELAPAVGSGFDTALAGALRAIDAADADGDGVSNGDELRQGTLPGDSASVSRTISVEGGTNPSYSVGMWDSRFALRRVKAAFCGRSPDYEDFQALQAAPDQRAFVHAALDTCLKSKHWRDEALPRLADMKIRPLGAAGTCLNFYGNFEPDYALFVWALTDGRDARLLLRSQQHVQRNPDGTLSPIDESRGPILAPATRLGIVCKDRYANVPSKVGGGATRWGR
jgi:hypothetical protein